jgi:hypothetical protein
MNEFKFWIWIRLTGLWNFQTWHSGWALASASPLFRRWPHVHHPAVAPPPRVPLLLLGASAGLFPTSVVPPFKRAPPHRHCSPFPAPLSSNNAHCASPPSPLPLVRFGRPKRHHRFSPPSLSLTAPPSSFSFGWRLTPGSLPDALGCHHRRRRHRRSSPLPERRPRNRPTPFAVDPPLRWGSRRPTLPGHLPTVHPSRFRGWAGLAGRSHGPEPARFCARVFDFCFLLYF